MKHHLAFYALNLISITGLACEPDAAMQLAAIRTLYSDTDIARYVCADDSECTREEFSRKVEVRPVTLNNEGTPAIQIEPRRKGAQYFSAIFLLEECKYKMVFAPDTTLSSVKLLKTKKNNFYIVRAVERDSAEAWKEYDFFYDLVTRQYGAPTARCYKAHGAGIVRARCD